jgi:formylglycine-generating enzyme required for sulfatase activity
MGDGEEDDCPTHLVCLERYFIGIYAVTNWQYRRFVEATGHRLPESAEWGLPVWRDRSHPNQFADHPVVCVNWEDAVAYCQWAGLSLPTEAQWEKAARGPEGYRYPWGNEWVSANCLNYMNKGLEQTCAVHAYPQGMSGYGLFNTSGNVLEWCADWYDEQYYRAGPVHDPAGPPDGCYRAVRGGSWGSGPVECRSACRCNYNLPEERAGFRGFRVALTRAQYSS